MRKSFSLIEVLFAIAFLVMVGVAMISLNSAASRLTQASEIKQVALALNEQSVAFLSIEKRTRDDFASYYAACINGGKVCYVDCPEDTSDLCTLSATRSSTQVGSNKLSFSQSVTIKSTGSTGQYLVNATSAWGAGPRSRLSSAKVIE